MFNTTSGTSTTSTLNFSSSLPDQWNYFWNMVEASGSCTWTFTDNWGLYWNTGETVTEFYLTPHELRKTQLRHKQPKPIQPKRPANVIFHGSWLGRRKQ